ncbi:MAG: hypothetical protein PWQ70_3262 [Clostridiales bacterium]|jgi:GTPase SAR1 family protein|nr:hypothetical protein [Clostridiales bacterium]
MLKKGSVKRVFPGGNTPKGFYSYYQYILGQEEATRIICIKGGPGVGKSTFMKNIANQMVDRGYDVELMHCSSDNNSLDGVVIKDIKVALLDGTAPHVVDPKNPGAVDEILHLGDFWNEDGIRQYKEQILKINATVGKLFARAYKYLAAAKSIYDDIVTVNKEAMNAAGVYLEVEKIIEKELSQIPTGNVEGKTRKLFASAITPNGLCNYLDTIINDKYNIYTIKGAPGTGTERLLSRIVDAVVQRGIDVEVYYCPMEPENRIEHVIIPELNLAFTTSNEYHTITIDTATVIELNHYLNKNILDKYSEVLTYDIESFNALLNKAIETIKEAKKAHDVMETYYIPNMDFGHVQVCQDKILARILQYAEELTV